MAGRLFQLVAVWAAGGLLLAGDLPFPGQPPPESISIQAPPGTPLHRRTIPRVTRPPRLEDFLCGIPREAELVLGDFRQYGPVAGAPSSAPTTAYLSYDDQNLYAAFVCQDDPALIRAHLAKRDKLDAEDRVSIGLDTFNDRHRCYWFDTNPYGCQQDGMTIDGMDDYNWDAVYTSEARLTASGYVVLTTIPFKSLRFPSRPVQEWNFNVCRLIARNNEISTWPPMSPDVLGWATQFARLDGIERVSQGRNLQIVPYAMYSDSRYLDEEAAPPGFQTRREARVGVDAKVILDDALTLDTTVRPDFSQVESDAPQVTVNQRFEVIYPEKRPFFLENANLFQTPTQLFFSRRIADPRVGARLTGKQGPWALGALMADDMAPMEQQGLDGDTVQVPDHRAGIGVARVAREFGHDDRIGLLVTSRRLGQGFNRLLAMDGRYRVHSNWMAEGQWMKSETKRLDGQRFEGSAGMARLTWSDRHVYYSLQYDDRSPLFRADLGYLDQVDIRRTSQYVNHFWRPDRGALLAYGPTLWLLYQDNQAGLRQKWEVLPGFEAELTRQTRLRVQYYQAFERWKDLEFRKHQAQASASSEPFPWLGASALYNQGTEINYYPAAGLKPFLGESRFMTAGLTLRPTAQLSIENALIYTSLATRDLVETPGGDPAPPRGTPIYTNRILRSKWNYQFTPELSLRAILDYFTLDPNARLANPDDQKERRLGVDLLFTYFLHPGTAVYFGYSDICQNRALEPGPAPAVRHTDGIGLSTQRLFYLKLSYLLRP